MERVDREMYKFFVIKGNPSLQSNFTPKVVNRFTMFPGNVTCDKYSISAVRKRLWDEIGETILFEAVKAKKYE